MNSDNLQNTYWSVSSYSVIDQVLSGSISLKPGKYGETSTNTIVLLPNYHPLVYKFLEKYGQEYSVISFDAGGYGVLESAAFQSFTAEKVQLILEEYAINSKDKRILYVPSTIAKHLEWEKNENISGYDVQFCSDNVLEGVVSEAGNQRNNWLARFGIRVLSGLRSFFGQAILFSIPLLILGGFSLPLILSAMLISMFLLCFFWELPIAGWLKGLMIGVFLAIIVGFIPVSELINSGDINMGIRVVVLIVGFWTGMILNGTNR
ncbi:MAG: hypothetical protein JEZ06_03610 [Anaerolineaceae bacterium]|nr:hypothetical protein [Anaerolineaceae bacterium]